MKTVTLDDADAAQVQAILRTHAEMQDSRINPSMGVLARMKRDQPDETGMIADLTGQIETFEDDKENLQRIADLFV